MKKILSLLMVCCLSFSFLVGCNSNLSNEIKEITIIMNEAQIEKEQAELIYNQLKNIGVEEFDEFKHDTMLDAWDYDTQTGYRIKGDGFTNLILYLDGNKQVDIIRYAGVNIYKNNEIVNNFNNLIFDSDEEVFIKTQTQLEVKKYLLAPNSADFPWFDWDYKYSSCLVEGSKLNNVNLVEVVSYVEAKNSFGVKVRNYFKMVFCNALDTNTWTKIYLSINNEVYYDFLHQYLKT